MRGRCLPPACPVGAAPRRPWIGDPSQRRRGIEASSGRTIARRGVRGSTAPRAAASPSHAEGESTEPEHQLRACSRLTARPQPQQPEPELQWVATTERGGEGKLGRAQTPHPGRLGLATPLLRISPPQLAPWLCGTHHSTGFVRAPGGPRGGPDTPLPSSSQSPCRHVSTAQPRSSPNLCRLVPAGGRWL